MTDAPTSGRTFAVFRLGDRAAEVAELKDRLAALELLPGDAVGDRDEYDAALERAVRAFQQRRGLNADGVVVARPTGPSRRRTGGSATGSWCTCPAACRPATT